MRTLRRTPSTTSRILTACALLGALACAPAAGAQNQEIPKLPAPEAKGGPPDPTASSAESSGNALAAARADLLALEQRFAKEAEELSAKIAAQTAEVDALAKRDRELRERFESLLGEEEKLDKSLEVLTIERDNLKLQIQGANNEIVSQAGELLDRFKASIYGVENPQFVARVEALVLDNASPLAARLQTFLALLDTVRVAAGTAGAFRAEVQLVDAGGKVAQSDVLRIGFLTGFFSTPAVNEAGYIVLSPDGSGKLLGRSEGTHGEQESAIAALVANPANGGSVTMDVTGGAGIASIQTHDTFKVWFEKGGVFMWPLAVLGVFCAIIALERGISLAIRSAVVARHVNKVLALVKADRVDEAIAFCDKTRGITCNVLQSALIHADRDRSVMEDAVQEALLHNSPTLHKRLTYLAMIAATAPLTGLLGTVTGMILTFKSMTIFGTSDPRYMAGGISEALTATEAGLIVAIPATLLRGFLGAIADGTLGKLEAGAMSVVLALLKRKERREAATSNPRVMVPETVHGLMARAAATAAVASSTVAGAAHDNGGKRS